MSGTPDSSLDTLENKLRTLHLSEGQIRNSLTEPILKAILPGSVGVKLKTCIGEIGQPVVILLAHVYVEYFFRKKGQVDKKGQGIFLFLKFACSSYFPCFTLLWQFFETSTKA